VRPGPESIEPGRAPGGIVIHVYNLAGLLLLERRLVSVIAAEHFAGVDVDAVLERLRAAGEGACVLVAFDGDDGHRMMQTSSARAAHPSAARVVPPV
jgi:hypothetical protein